MLDSTKKLCGAAALSGIITVGATSFVQGAAFYLKATWLQSATLQMAFVTGAWIGLVHPITVKVINGIAENRWINNPLVKFGISFAAVAGGAFLIGAPVITSLAVAALGMLCNSLGSIEEWNSDHTLSNSIVSWN